MFYLTSILWKPVGFLMRKRKGMALNGKGSRKEMGRRERGGNYDQDIVCKKIIYNKKDKKENF